MPDRCHRATPRLHELDITIDAERFAYVLRRYRWRLTIDDRDAFGRALTYKRALRELLATAEAIRQLSIIDADLSGVPA